MMKPQPLIDRDIEMMMHGGDCYKPPQPMSISMGKPPKIYQMEDSKEDKPRYMNIAMDPDTMKEYLNSHREQTEYNKCVCCAHSFT
jgi:hypothetical protein